MGRYLLCIWWLKAHCSDLSQNKGKCSLKPNYVFQYRTQQVVIMSHWQNTNFREYEIIPPLSTLLSFSSWLLCLWHFCVLECHQLSPFPDCKNLWEAPSMSQRQWISLISLFTGEHPLFLSHTVLLQVHTIKCEITCIRLWINKILPNSPVSSQASLLAYMSQLRYPAFSSVLFTS